MKASVDPGILALLGRGRIHPALHADEHGVALGRTTEAGKYQLITSGRRMYEAEDLEGVFAFKARPWPDLAGRWADDDAADFCASDDAPASLAAPLALIIGELDRAVEFPRKELRALVAAWALGTYFVPLFLAFPRLNLTGERGSGKSKLLLILRAAAWNAILMMNPTPAVLFRLAQEFRPTLLIDEAEGMAKEDQREILSILNAGYKAGGTVARVEGKDARRVELFSVYTPAALAAIRPLNGTTADRCLSIRLQRGRDRRRLNAPVDIAAPGFARIRALAHRALLTRWQDVATAYARLAEATSDEMPAWLNARARELWLPLLAVAAVADRDNGLRLTPDLLALARAHVDDADDASPETEALIMELDERVSGAGPVVIRPRDLGDGLRARLGWPSAPTPEMIGAWLRRLEIPRGRPKRDREGTRYEVTASRVADLRALYLPGTDGPEGGL